MLWYTPGPKAGPIRVLTPIPGLAPIREFSSRIFRVHLKDLTIDRPKLNEIGMFAYPNEFHTPKLPGRGDVDWPAFLKTLKEAGYDGPTSVEVEERIFEIDLEHRKEALALSYQYLKPLF